MEGKGATSWRKLFTLAVVLGCTAGFVVQASSNGNGRKQLLLKKLPYRCWTALTSSWRRRPQCRGPSGPWAESHSPIWEVHILCKTKFNICVYKDQNYNAKARLCHLLFLQTVCSAVTTYTSQYYSSLGKLMLKKVAGNFYPCFALVDPGEAANLEGYRDHWAKESLTFQKIVDLALFKAKAEDRIMYTFGYFGCVSEM